MRIILAAAGLFATCSAALAAPTDDEIIAAYRAYEEAAKAGDKNKKETLARAEQAYLLGVEGWGAGNRQTGALASNYGQALSVAGRDGDAARAYAHCAELLAGYPEKYSDKARCQLNAADSYLRTKDREKAAVAFNAVIAEAETRPAEDKDALVFAGEAYVGHILYNQVDRPDPRPRATIGSGETSSRIEPKAEQKFPPPDEVETYAAKAIEKFRAAKATNSESYKYALDARGSLAELRGDYELARATYAEAAEVLAALYGPNDERTITMQGRTKFAEKSHHSLNQDIASRPTTREPSGRDCRVGWSGDLELELCVELRIPPYFPNSELFKGRQGFAIIRYDVNEAGRVENPKVVLEWPGGIFTERALAAVAKWKYFPPKDASGEIHRFDGAETQLIFRIKN